MSSSSAFRVLDIASSGMAAERKRLEVVAANIANAQTLKAEDGLPYRRRDVVFEAVMDRARGGEEALPLVRVAGTVVDQKPFPRVSAPGHPLAVDGYLAMPNVDMVFEMVDLMEAMRSYEANMRSVKAFRTMADAALAMGRG